MRKIADYSNLAAYKSEAEKCKDPYHYGPADKLRYAPGGYEYECITCKEKRIVVIHPHMST